MVNENSMSILDSTTAIRTIRSHRAPKKVRRVHRWGSGVAAVAVLAASFTLPGGSDLPPAHADAPAAIHAVVDAPLPARVAPMETSRSPTLRKAAKPSRTTRINTVINYAMAQRGDRYRFGATGPSRWDCSGLVMKSYAKIGVKLPHYTGGMLKKGKKVSRKNLQRGDLIFPSSHHVGIYIGGNKMIVASSGHGKVMVQSVYAFYTARRII